MSLYVRRETVDYVTSGWRQKGAGGRLGKTGLPGSLNSKYWRCFPET